MLRALRARASADFLGVDARRRRSRAARRGCTWRIRAAGRRSAGDEVITTPFSFVASANCVLYEGAKPVFVRHRPAHAEHRPGRRPRRPSRERTTGLLPVHIFGYPADMAGVRAARRAARAVDRRGRLRGARRGARRRRAGRRARQPRGVRLLPEQADDDRRGRRGRLPRRRRQGAASTRSATRAARRTWTGSTTTGSASTTACRTSRARSASRRSSGSASCWTARARGRGALRRGARGRRGARAAVPGRGRRPPQLVRLRRAAAARRSTATRRSSRCGERGHRDEALPAGDPPDELLPRALRLARGPVPGLRGRGRAARSRCRSSRS